MSAYGPALFVPRKAGADLTVPEEERVFELVREVCVGLQYSSYAYAGMPEEVWGDVEHG